MCVCVSLSLVCAAIGEIVVYVDGMNGLMRCPEVIQWLYSLMGSKVGVQSTLEAQLQGTAQRHNIIIDAHSKQTVCLLSQMPAPPYPTPAHVWLNLCQVRHLGHEICHILLATCVHI